MADEAMTGSAVDTGAAAAASGGGGGDLLFGSQSPTGSAPLPVLNQPSTSTPSFLDSVPAEYRDKPWVQDLAKSEDPMTALWKTSDSAQALIGKKVGLEVPGADATPEAVKAFHKALGVPDSPDGYDYKMPALAAEEPEALKVWAAELAKDDSFIKPIKQAALDAGVTPAQFQKLAAEYDKLNLAQMKTQLEAGASALSTKIETQKEQVTKLYGDQTDLTLKMAKETMAKVIPENIRNLNDAELSLVEAMRFINEKLYKNDSIGGGAGAGQPEQSYEQLQAKVFELRARPEFKNFQAAGHAALHTQVDALYAQMAAKKSQMAQ